MNRDQKIADKLSGPVYPAWDNLAKFRKLADKAGGVAKLDAKTSDAYAQTLFANIKRENLARATKGDCPAHSCPCASGSYASTGDEIIAAVKAKIARECEAAAKREQSMRLAKCDWNAEYDAAMVETRKARAQSAPVAEIASPALIAPANTDAPLAAFSAPSIAFETLIATFPRRATKPKAQDSGLDIKTWQISHARNRARIEARNVLR